MRRTRTLPQALKEIREQDPETAITYNTLRMWVLKGVIPSVRAGKNFLVDMDKVEAFLSCDN